MKKEVSKFLTLNLFDLFKSLVMFVLAAIGELSIQVFTILLEHLKWDFNWFRVFNIGLVTLISYLIKQYFTGRKQEPEPFKPQKIR
jgi:hypothetical protein